MTKNKTTKPFEELGKLTATFKFAALFNILSMVKSFV